MGTEQHVIKGSTCRMCYLESCSHCTPLGPRRFWTSIGRYTCVQDEGVVAATLYASYGSAAASGGALWLLQTSVSVVPGTALGVQGMPGRSGDCACRPAGGLTSEVTWGFAKVVCRASAEPEPPQPVLRGHALPQRWGSQLACRHHHRNILCHMIDGETLTAPPGMNCLSEGSLYPQMHAGAAFSCTMRTRGWSPSW